MQGLKISAVIPCYNAGESIVGTLESLLQQSTPVAEIIVVDDGSRDDSAQIVERYAPHVTLIRQHNQGAARARFNGVKASRGDVVVFTDAGDVSTLDRIERFRDRFEQDDGLVACYARTFLKAEGRASKAPVDQMGAVLGVVTDPLLVLLGQSWPLAIGMNFAARREVALHAADVPAFYRAANDYALQIRAAVHGAFGFIDAPTLEYEVTPGGISAAHGLRKQNTYALLAAAEALNGARGDAGAYRKAFADRLNGEGGELLAEMYLQRQYPLARRVLTEVLRHGRLAIALRQFWWHLDQQEGLGRLPPRSLGSSAIRMMRGLKGR